MTRGPLGLAQVTEFTGLWETTGKEVHGVLWVDVASQASDAYLIMAATPIWPGMTRDLLLIRNHIIYKGG